MSVDHDRDQQILSRLARIEHRLDSIDETAAFALRADADKHFGSVKEIFGSSKRRAQVYLAANGQRSVQEIAAHLGMKSPNVSSELTELGREGVLEVVDTHGNQNIWAKKPLDKTLRISIFLKGEFQLDADGKPSSGSKKKRRRAGRARA